MRFNVWAAANLLALIVDAGANDTIDNTTTHAPRPFFAVPGLLQVRDILAQLEAPIVATIVQRVALPVELSSYTDGKAAGLTPFLAAQEKTGQALGRYGYGTLEYAFTLPPVSPDVATPKDPFPPGRFHQDKFIGNANISTFYRETFIPSFSNLSVTPFYFHLSNASSTPDSMDDAATFTVDAALMGLLSHRAHIGKVVAEAKYLGNSTQYAELIKAKDADAIRTLLTNTTQETQVLAQADAAASSLASAWTSAGAIVPSGFVPLVQAITKVVFRELIDITTEIEIEYLLERL